MKLTKNQEEQLLMQYDRLIWNIVHRFRRRRHDVFSTYDDREDLHSECVLVFLQHIRSCETMDDIRKIPTRDMIHAMCICVLGEQVCSYPKRTTNYRQIMESVAGKADISKLEWDESQMYEPLDDTLDEIAFKNFFASLPEDDQKIIVMKLKGSRNREIARDLGVTDVVMTRALKRLQNFYRVHAA